jgi:hypothetical protein
LLSAAGVAVLVVGVVDGNVGGVALRHVMDLVDNPLCPTLMRPFMAGT